MAIITERLENDVLYLELNGRIDSSNADQAEEGIKAIRSEHPDLQVVLDADNLEYLSSTGLRVFLMMAKRLGSENVFVDNANALIREIFDTTGFSEVVTIR